MKIINVKSFFDSYSEFLEPSLHGRRITIEDIKPIVDNLFENCKTKVLGSSELNKPIYEIEIGKGKRKILIWTQMHGNESTGTKSVFDFLRFLEKQSSKVTSEILNNCLIKIVPILNPDGAEKYKRVNANKIDLNRDAVEKDAKESKLLSFILHEFNPDFCFNMHDQRTIFGISNTKLPATLSFLAPSEEFTRKVTTGRKKTMNIIVVMNKALKQLIPRQIGRYTDEFYPKATGDNFQKMGFNTVLIESGHFKEDYEREEVRKYTMLALLQGVYHIATAQTFSEYNEYFSIPENEKIFYDELKVKKNNTLEVYQFEEVLKEGKIQFIPKKVENIDPQKFLYHKETVFKDELT